MNDEKYDFTVGEEGLDYDILDYTFNKTTKEFMLNNGLKEGMNILEIGCGSGIMTSWIAKQIGDNGHITSIDNSQEQIHFAQKSTDKQQLMNVSFKCISAYDLEELNMKFDLVYCRFVLHHLHSPRQAIKIFYNCLNHKGIYIAEEGIISSAFSYPPYTSWHHERGTVKQPEIEKDGIDRDGDFGIKLSYNMQDSGFTIN
ncbi:MAG: class I SAM-dependent methyltransferase, partial [Francisellaceae bacterium]|nr:class I SAM-dependent methyltransferase [Francisellaceae bacterium]